MASKRNIPTLKSAIASPAIQAVSQRPRSPPPSPPPALTLKDLQDALKLNFTQFKAEMTETIEKKNTQIREDIIEAFTGLALNIERIDFNMEEIKHNASEVENRVEVLEHELAISQFREMEFAIRIRGLRENPKEDLKALVSKEIGLSLGCKPEHIGYEIEKIFRVNSRVARQRNLPRDVVIYFTRKSLRNEIIQAFFKQRFQIADQDVIILKEIPLKILRGRKNFSFLTDELKRRQIQFRWEIPTGISLIYEGIRYRLLTVTKAKEFFYSILKASGPFPPQLQQQQQQGELLERSSQLQQQQQQGELLERSAEAAASWPTVEERGEMVQKTVQSEIKEQRMTRAAYRRKEREDQQKLSDKTQTIVYTEPVGGARPKGSSTADLRALLSRLQAGPDGQVPDLEC